MGKSFRVEIPPSGGKSALRQNKKAFTLHSRIAQEGLRTVLAKKAHRTIAAKTMRRFIYEVFAAIIHL